MKAGWFVHVSCACLVAASSASAHADEIKPVQAAKAAAAATSAAASPAPSPELPDLVTDRPDITESSAVVGRGVWQVESGFAFERDGHAGEGSRGLAAPMALVRLGVSERVELRLGTDGFLSTKPVAGGARSSGLADFNAGVKVVLADQAHLGVDMAVIPFVSVPTGSSEFSSGGWDPTVKFTWARDLPRGFGLSGNVNVSSVTEEHERYTPTEVMFSLGHDLAGGWAGFWEVYTTTALERGGSAAWLVDTGVTHPWGHNAQIDVSVGRGLNDAAPSWFVGAGISMRGLFHRAGR